MDQIEKSMPTVTLADVNRAIVAESYTVLPNGRTTVCQLTLDNDFTVEGSSACVYIENFDAFLGEQMARKNAVNEVWKLLGFRLADKLTAAALATPVAVAEIAEEVSFKIVELGDQVHFFERVGDKESAAMVGTVSAVLDATNVGLCVLAPNGTVHARDRVSVIYPGMAIPETAAFYARLKR